MNRLAAFLIGTVFGASAVSISVAWLAPLPSVRLTVDWSDIDRATPATDTTRLSGLNPAAAQLHGAVTATPPAATAAARPAPRPASNPAATTRKTELPGTASPPTPPAHIAAPTLLIPVAGIQSVALFDTFNQDRGSERRHEAIDIMAARGTPVLAAGAGRVAKLFTSAQGGLTIYQFDPSETYAYYYAHLDAYAPGLAEGDLLARGDVIGAVGSSGNAQPAAPHLHFAVFLLGPERNWWQGVAINPYPLLEK